MAGNTQAQHSVALLYHMGYGGLSKSDALSTCWHAIAAAQGHHDSLAVLGGCLRKGSGIDRDVSLAMDCIQAAAAEGSAYGYVKLGALAEENEDYSSAFSYYKKACDSTTPKSALALFSLGWALMEFSIDIKDMSKKERKAEAQQCWKQSIALAPFDGSDEAAYHLGMYLGGLWHPSGKKYLELAAQLGNEDARKEFKSQVNILESYFDGEYEER
ncbi:hypothetical protein TrVE_jg691 [Triparma verrucosa]|nr:hypothetical protein TrVE_jg691 [Triparma verrucosa]